MRFSTRAAFGGPGFSFLAGRQTQEHRVEQHVQWQQRLREGYARFAAADFLAAEARAGELLAALGEQPAALLLQSLSRAALGRPGDAVEGFRRLVVLQPEVAEHWINLGVAERQLGHGGAALQALLRAEQLGAAHPEFVLDLAAALLDGGDFAAARTRLLRLQARAPNTPGLALELARCAVEAGEMVEARQWMLQAESVLADEPAVLSDAGSLWLQIGEAARGEALLLRAEQRAPRDADVRARRLLLLERTNRIDEAVALLQRGDVRSTVELRQAEAKLLARQGRNEEAIAAYRRLLAEDGAPAQQHKLCFELGKLLDQSGDAEAAMQAFAAAHAGKAALIRASHPRYFDDDNDLLKMLRFASAAEDIARWVAPPADARPAPVFVVGFPRSGTTLLEQILDAHPALQAMDEQPFLQRVIDRVLRLDVAYPERLADLNEAQLVQLRAGYYADVATVVTLQPGQRLVDKNPLNLARLPMIRRLFPDAPIILALRHPLDVVLSCYMQPFRAPAFALLCDTPASTAAAYRRMMQGFLDEQSRLPPSALEWRYEDLVADYRGQVGRLLDFLGLDWVDALDDIAASARRRGFISTPSYHQVVEPINARAIGRWQRYRPWLDPLIETLTPLAQRWNYRL